MEAWLVAIASLLVLGASAAAVRWRRVASAAAGPVLELGCGTGRVSLPLALWDQKRGNIETTNARKVQAEVSLNVTLREIERLLGAYLR